MRRDLVIEILASVQWAKVFAPDSGAYIWCDIGELGCDTVAFSEMLLSEGRVAVMPGDAHGHAGFIRIGFIADDIETLRRGIHIIKTFGSKVADGSVRLASR